MYGIFDAVNVS